MAPQHGQAFPILRQLHPCSHQGCSQVQGGRAGWAAHASRQLAVQQPNSCMAQSTAHGCPTRLPLLLQVCYSMSLSTLNACSRYGHMLLKLQ